MKGKRFLSYNDLARFIECYHKENDCQLYKSDSRKLISNYVQEKYKLLFKLANKDLIYYSIKYRCVAGGKYEYSGNFVRKSSTLRKGCPFFINIGLSADGQTLVIKDFVDAHNHPINNDLYKAVPQQQILSSRYQKELQPKTTSSKYTQAMFVCEDICSALTEFGTVEYNSALNELYKIRDSFRQRRSAFNAQDKEKEAIEITNGLASDSTPMIINENSVEHSYCKQITLSNISFEHFKCKRLGRPREVDKTVINLKKKRMK